MADEYASSDKLPQQIQTVNQSLDSIWKQGWFRFSEDDFVAVTGGYLATKDITLFRFTVDPMQEGAEYMFWRPHIEVYHLTKDGSSSAMFDGVDMDLTPLSYTIFENYSTGEVQRWARARLYYSYGVPIFLVRLKVEYFTNSATGQTWSIDGINFFTWHAYTMNVLKPAPDFGVPQS